MRIQIYAEGISPKFVLYGDYIQSPREFAQNWKNPEVAHTSRRPENVQPVPFHSIIETLKTNPIKLNADQRN